MSHYALETLFGLTGIGVAVGILVAFAVYSSWPRRNNR